MNKYRIKFIELEGGEWNLDRAEPTLTVRSYGADRLHAVENAIASRLVRDKLRRLLGLTGKQFVQLFYSASFEGLIQEVGSLHPFILKYYYLIIIYYLG